MDRRPNTEMPLESSQVDVDLDLEHRQKGLLWYSTYKIRFAGVYGFRNATDKEQNIVFKLQFPTTQAIYDNLTFTVDGNPATLSNENNAAKTSVKVGPGKTAQLAVGYSSQGLNEWRYSFGHTDVSQVKDFNLRMSTNFKDIDFPDNTLSPSEKHETGKGWDLTWSYKSLLSGYQIAMVMPEKLQPGPLAGRISLFAPVSLFFFFFLMLIITTMRGIDLHPMNYFFLAAAFFSFHLLLAYLVDHVSIHAAFAIAARCLGVSGCELPATRRGNRLREPRGRAGAVHLPRVVLLRIFPQGLHRTRDHCGLGANAVCGDAGDWPHPLGREIRGRPVTQAGRRNAVGRNKSTC